MSSDLYSDAGNNYLSVSWNHSALTHSLLLIHSYPSFQITLQITHLLSLEVSLFERLIETRNRCASTTLLVAR